MTTCLNRRKAHQAWEIGRNCFHAAKVGDAGLSKMTAIREGKARTEITPAAGLDGALSDGDAIVLSQKRCRIRSR